jgi:hypothetical protein
MSRLAALAAALLLALAPARALADIMDGQEPPPLPQSVPTGRYGIVTSLVLRIPSGPGFDLAFRPWKRLEVGAEISTWVLVLEAGAYVRGAFVTETDNSLWLGARFHGIVVNMGEREGGSPTSKLLSAELGFTHLTGATFWGVDIAKAAWIDGVWGNDRRIGITAECRFGQVW